MNLFLRGFLIGMAIAAPVGPIGMLCIRRTLAFGRRAGFLSGLGAATADAVYGCIAGFGLVLLSSYLISQASWIRLVGGLFMIYLGLQAFRSKSEIRSGELKDENLTWMYFSTFILTLTNPMTILSFAAIFTGLGILGEQSYFGAGLLVLGVFSGSGTWWFILSYVSSIWRLRLQPTQLKWVNWLAGMVLLVFGAIALLGLTEQPKNIQSNLVQRPPLSDAYASAEGFERADGVRPIIFPLDHGAHPEFQTEWWYYTGNLWTAEGERFGYQLTFFRRALLPPSKWSERLSSWGSEQVYMVHFALTNVSENRHDEFKQLTRGSADLSGAEFSPFRVWLDQYQVYEIETNKYRLQAKAFSEDGMLLLLDLILEDTQGPTLQGVQGYSQKGPEPGNASYYYSLANLSTSGNLTFGHRTYSIRGSSWMDHEYSTSALSGDQVGWDWFSVQLDDGNELMLFQIRKADGTVDPFSSGTMIYSDGRQLHLTREDFEIQVLDTWRSPESGAVYPSHWRVTIPNLGVSLTITPVVNDQELSVSYSYWEGAVDIRGDFFGKTVTGVGYVELTGYSGSMAGEF